MKQYSFDFNKVIFDLKGAIVSIGWHVQTQLLNYSMIRTRKFFFYREYDWPYSIAMFKIKYV